MSTKIMVHVTSKILEKTMDCDVSCGSMYGQNCAVALAIIELIPLSWVETDTIFVFNNCLQFTKQGNINTNAAGSVIKLPLVAQRFINAFDLSSPYKRCAMDEISFEIEIPDEALESIDISEVHRILKDSKTLSLVH